MKQLSNITLVSIDTKNPEMATQALIESSKHIKFGKLLLLSNTKPFNLPSNIDFIQIEEINSLGEYGQFVLHKLSDYIKTDFCITIHADGYICNPESWTDEFLNYDYIGAPWQRTEHFVLPNARVGNGGFSLRSKKLLEFSKQLPTHGHEDVIISVNARQSLENVGIKYAPLELAAKFSTEKICDDLTYSDTITSFGFHGKDYTNDHKRLIKNLIFSFYKDNLIKMSDDRLLHFLRNEVGVSESAYFQANYVGNLEVQQIPEEYLQLLNFFKNSDIKTYLELGVANGGSFFINSIFLQNTAQIINCVDSIAYRDTHVKQTEGKILSKVNKLKELFPNKQFEFYNSTTDNFFENICNKNYDCIFIDADHSYEAVLKDYENSLKFVSSNGYLIFHDIANATTGVARCWNEIKSNHSIIGEYIHPYVNNCGIGILKV